MRLLGGTGHGQQPWFFFMVIGSEGKGLRRALAVVEAVSLKAADGFAWTSHSPAQSLMQSYSKALQ